MTPSPIDRRAVSGARRPLSMPALAALGLLLLGCAGNGGSGGNLVGGSLCEDPERYAGATSADPLMIPDHLSPPDDRNALWIPPQPAVDPEPIERLGECLESPPRFFAQG